MDDLTVLPSLNMNPTYSTINRMNAPLTGLALVLVVYIVKHSGLVKYLTNLSPDYIFLFK